MCFLSLSFSFSLSLSLSPIHSHILFHIRYVSLTHIYTHTHICMYTSSYLNLLAQSASGLEYTDCIFAEGYPSNECPGYNTKRSEGEVPVMLELWGMPSTSSLPSLPDPLRPWVVAPDKVISMGQRELNCIHMLNWIVWNRTVLKFNCVDKNYSYIELELFY